MVFLFHCLVFPGLQHCPCYILVTAKSSTDLNIDNFMFKGHKDRYKGRNFGKRNPNLYN